MIPKTVILGSDARGLEPNATVIASLLAHTEGPVWVRMFSRDIEPVVVRSGRLTLEVIRTPEELRLEGRVPAHVSVGGTFDRIAAIPYCVDWERAVILDYDQVVVGQVSGLFEMDLGGALAAGRMWGAGRTLGAACREWFGREMPAAWQECEGYRYFYMGPVLNLAALREADAYGRFIRFHAEANMEEQIALHVACRDRVVEFDAVFNAVPQWDGIGPNTRVLHFTGPAKPWDAPGLPGAPLWRRHETTWEELTCGLWPTQARRGRAADAVWGRIRHALASLGRHGRAMRVLEIGGWEFDRSIGMMREALRGGEGKWMKVFRPHVDAEALEQAIGRFAERLGDLAAATEIHDGDPVESLAWLLASGGGWETLDAVIIHAPRDPAGLLAEAVLAWRALRPGGMLVIHPVARKPGKVARARFRQALDGFASAMLDQVAAVHRGYETIFCKAEGPGCPQGAVEAADARMGRADDDGWTVVVTSYGERGTPHLESLRLGNPRAQVLVAVDERLGNKRELWRNCDGFLRDWWRQNRTAVRHDRVMFIEHDVRVNGRLPDWRGLGIAGKDRKDPIRDPGWIWWSERAVVESHVGRVVGLAPLGVLLASREALERLASPEWDALYREDVFCELRLPSVVASCGLPVEETPLPWVWHFPGKFNPALPGIHHPVK